MEKWRKHVRHTEQLAKDFPVLMENVYCGISYGPGWDALIRKCAAKIEALDPRVRCAQIKEKYGTLRFYVDGPEEGTSPEVFAAIDEAECASAVTCEDCGASGTMRKRGWLRTLCDACCILRK